MKKTLLVMSKSPVLGYVKTRMQPHLSETQSLKLHVRLAQYCLQQWVDSKGFAIHLWIGGDVDIFRADVLLPMASRSFAEQSLYPQPEGDLGKRMLFAVDSVLNTSEEDEAVFLVGTDCPFIDKPYLELAFAALEKSDVVLGPATDGGYVLLGMKKSHAVLFDNVSWGSSAVLTQTQSIIQKACLKSVLLPPLPDIDVVEDLNHLHGCKGFESFLRKTKN
jgi:rSAM/selenodomain-associated transferase 1